MSSFGFVLILEKHGARWKRSDKEAINNIISELYVFKIFVNSELHYSDNKTDNQLTRKHSNVKFYASNPKKFYASNPKNFSLAKGKIILV